MSGRTVPDLSRQASVRAPPPRPEESTPTGCSLPGSTVKGRGHRNPERSSLSASRRSSSPTSPRFSTTGTLGSSTASPPRHVVTFDNRGVGASSGSTPRTIQAMAKDAVTFIRALGLEYVDLHGFSMGGMVAQVMRRPNRTSSAS
ncbi:alpha/beta fold hydrolase [Streptomyces aurantiogriseus]|uniref:alpha/beta fold hydrolase n=1 Tax=Streptomyces aurantiogriseus TaxID=66870 RepID=UPI001E4707F8|nr:alpha/beta hydrolase [Streptomyces aurantiogriseus]